LGVVGVHGKDRFWLVEGEMIVDIRDPSCDIVELFNEFAYDLGRGAVKSKYWDKTEFDGIYLYHWITKDNIQPGKDPLDIAIEEFSQAFDCTSDLLTVWLKAGLISQDELTRHYRVKEIK
jgi:hypothetical protein